jgi:hypothetical protein
MQCHVVWRHYDTSEEHTTYIRVKEEGKQEASRRSSQAKYFLSEPNNGVIFL